MTGHRSWSADRRARLADPQVARAAAEARAELDRREEDYQRTLGQLRNARRPRQGALRAYPDPAARSQETRQQSGQGSTVKHALRP
jgi:hypothetical protein